MKGVLRKDFYMLKGQLKFMAALGILYVIIALVSGNIAMVMTVILFASMLPISTLTYDDFYKWDSFALTTPVSRKVLVFSKYVFGLLLHLAIAGLMSLFLPLAAFMFEINIKESFLMIWVFSGIGLLFLAIVFPIVFKIGAEKARMIMMLVFLIPTMLILLIVKLQMGTASITEQLITQVLYTLPVVSFVLLGVSYRVSLHIYEKREI